MSDGILLHMEGISKSFSGVQVLKNVHLDIGYGEVHALMGENGAGKSSLIKILTGIYMKDSGEILFNGNRIEPKNALDAVDCGISTIYQELNLIPYLSIAENIYLGREKRKKGIIDWRQTKKDAEEALRAVGLDGLNVNEPLYRMSTAIQQMVAIARAVSIRSQLLVMDEPTSSLDEGEVKVLFKVIRNLKKQGVSVIFIGHRISEIMEIADKVTILKDGEFVTAADMKDMDKIKLVSGMIGRDANHIYNVRKEYKNEDQFGETVCELQHISKGNKVVDVSVRLRKGEVVGMAGLVGSGRTETADIIFGVETPDSGKMIISGKESSIKSPKDAIRHKFAYCTEDRKVKGIFANLNIMQNITIASLDQFSKFGVISKRKQIQTASAYIDKIKIKTSGLSQMIKNLSGGNQQKVLISRWMCNKPDLIIFDEPTRGIDVGAKFEIEHLIQELVSEGIAVLMISSELEELTRNCDRVMVMREGKSVGELIGEEISEDSIMHMIAKENKSIQSKY